MTLAEAMGYLFRAATMNGSSKLNWRAAVVQSFPVLRKLFKQNPSQTVKIAQRTLDGSTITLVRARRAALRSQPSEGPKDFLTLMLEARKKLPDPSGQTHVLVPMTDEEVRDQTNNFLGAGYEATANLICYAIHLLAKNPETQEKLFAEIERSDTKRPDLEDVSSSALPYAHAIALETLRLFPAGPPMTRECERSCYLNDEFIPKGTRIQIPTFGLHRTAFDDSEIFKPERFLTDYRYGGYKPFGDGPRVCPAEKYALMHLKIALVRLCSVFQFSESVRHPQHTLSMVLTLALSPTDGVWVRFFKRTRHGDC